MTIRAKLSKSAALLLGLVAIAVQSAEPSGTSPYTMLYGFGDSYSDIGAGYLDGNGPTAVAYVAKNLGLSVTHSQDTDVQGKALIFAVTGAKSGESVGKKFGTALIGLGLINQVQDFNARVAKGEIKFDPKHTLFFVAIGLNDSEDPTATVAANITRAVTLLTKAGAQHISIGMLPTKIPDYSEVGRRLNPVYEALIPKLAKSLNADVRLNHWGADFDEVISHPDQFGITNTTDACAGRALFDEDATPCATPDAYFYFHSSHPSTAVHRIVGGMLTKEILAK